MSTRNTQWFLNNLELKNEENDLEALTVDTRYSHSTHTEIISSNKSSYDMITVASGKQILVSGVEFAVAGSVGEIALDFSDGTVVERLYTTNKTEKTSLSISIEGGDGNNLQFTGDGSGNDIFVAINYKILSV